jgi:hypothetical protein
MKPRHSLLLLSLPLAAAVAAPGADPRDRPDNGGQHSANPTPGSILAEQVSEIASAKDLSRRAKSKQISTAIRLAAIAATADAKNPQDAFKIVLDLVKQAAKAVPEFEEIIPQAVQDIAVLAGITDLKDALQAAAMEGVKAAAVENGVAHFEENESKRPHHPEFGGRDDDFVVSRSH